MLAFACFMLNLLGFKSCVKKAPLAFLEYYKVITKKTAEHTHSLIFNMKTKQKYAL